MNPRLRAALLVTTLFLAAVAVYLVVSQTRRQPRPFEGVLDINQASASELDRVPWMSPDMAAGIVAGRPWTRIDDLVRVSGIGDKTLEKVRPYLEIGN